MVSFFHVFFMLKTNNKYQYLDHIDVYSCVRLDMDKASGRVKSRQSLTINITTDFVVPYFWGVVWKLCHLCFNVHCSEPTGTICFSQFLEATRNVEVHVSICLWGVCCVSYPPHIPETLPHILIYYWRPWSVI